MGPGRLRAQGDLYYSHSPSLRMRPSYPPSGRWGPAPRRRQCPMGISRPRGDPDTSLAFLFTSDTDFASFSGLQIFRGVCPVRSNSLTHFARLFMLILMVATKLFAILSGAGRLDPGS